MCNRVQFRLQGTEGTEEDIYRKNRVEHAENTQRKAKVTNGWDIVAILGSGPQSVMLTCRILQTTADYSWARI